MYTLYGMTGSCSMAVHAVLHELNQPVNYVDVRVPEGQPRPAEFLKINPRGNVPVLVEEDGFVMREGGAILSYLLDKHNSPMLPKSGQARARALEWLMFANATLHPAYARVFFLSGAVKDAAAKEAALAVAFARINALWAEVEAELANQPFICGEAVSAADILLAVIANWGRGNHHGGIAEAVTFGPNLKRMLGAVSRRPAFAKTLAEEKVSYLASV